MRKQESIHQFTSGKHSIKRQSSEKEIEKLKNNLNIQSGCI